MIAKPILLIAGLLLAASVHAVPSAQNSDEVPPNSPLKERGFPDAGEFNPNWAYHDERQEAAQVVAPAAVYYEPMVVTTERAPRPYALVAAPTLPCAPAYCPRAVRRVRADRN